MTNRPVSAWFFSRASICALAVICLFSAGCIMRDAARNASEYVGNMLPEGGDHYGKRVVVVPFSAGTRKIAPLARDITTFLNSNLDKDSIYKRVEFKELAAKMKEAAKKVSLSEALMKAGREMGINAIITGVVTDLAMRYRLTGLYGLRENTPFLILEAQVRMADPVSGAVFSEKTLFQEVEIDETEAHNIRMGAEMKPERVAKLLREIKPDVSEWLHDELGDLKWGGVILKVENGRVLTTVGRDSGFSQGTELAVIAQGERLRSVTGQEVYIPGVTVGVIKLEEIGQTTTWASIIPQDPDDMPVVKFAKKNPDAAFDKGDSKTEETAGIPPAPGSPPVPPDQPQAGSAPADSNEPPPVIGPGPKPMQLPDGKVLPIIVPGQVVRPL